MVSRPGPRVFLDTNVLFSGVYSDSGGPRRILDAAARGELLPVASSVVIAELVRNLAQKAPSALHELELAFERVRFEMAQDVPAGDQQRWYDVRLGSDAPIVAAAVAAGVDYFCTGDRRLLELGRGGALAGLKVVSPGDLGSLLENAPADS